MAVISHSGAGYAPWIYSLNSWHMVRVLGVEAAEVNLNEMEDLGQSKLSIWKTST